jgi:hypothetical protein
MRAALSALLIDFLIVAQPFSVAQACQSPVCPSPSVGRAVIFDPLDKNIAYLRYPGTDKVLVALWGGGVLVKSNLAAGCAVWEWWWNGVEFVNDYDYGRQLQAAMYPKDGTSALSEAGDGYSSPSIKVDARHPSPCASFSSAPTGSGPNQTTAAIPLDYFPEKIGGGPHAAIIYPSVRIGKSITLDWIGPDKVERNWPVALYRTIINSPYVKVATVEAPTGYLNSQFNTYYIYDPRNKRLTQVALGDVRRATSHGPGYDVPLKPGPQAVILASGAGPNAVAMGVYINNPNSGFVFYDNSIGYHPGEEGSNFVKWEVHYYSAISAGTWTYDTWIMTDTVEHVLSDINQLNAWGLTSR